ncbi:thioredoxin family protein [Campylobacter sp. RM12327]|uniref:thioredoxin family protein n=1 Tax=Campylobacter sputorum TaxID=206 RepID=UPI000B79A09D|nr:MULTISPECIES: thioredoxin family protein [Campylobacter]ASM39964.1 thioredoxin domain protein [Campylobacter sputorum]MBE7357615.1 thioredoxin family protein [Campylobacter sp. RM11302]MBF6669261.1 thioredoxin family protein [Campylobacter sp. RM12327]MBF6674530.1 thioredoxin family protein [Campylobacter sp. RM13538]MBF6675483.1 thioredoxin family protein [Campylobacter sp. RM12321]
MFFKFKKAQDQNDSLDENARIKILGTGCKKCNELESNTLLALKELDMDEKVGHIKDLVKIVGYGVMSTPALLIDEKVLSYGRVLSVKEIVNLIKENFNLSL